MSSALPLNGRLVLESPPRVEGYLPGPPCPRSEAEARELILALVARHGTRFNTVAVEFNNNSSTMVSRTGKDAEAVLRLHRIFCTAPEDLLDSIVRCFFQRLRRRASREIRSRLKDYVQHHHHYTLRPVAPSKLLPPRGTAFDLAEVLDRVRDRYFPQTGAVSIGWSRRVLRRLMGKWIENPKPLPNLVLINRLLDTPEVPGYYLDFLVFHELLHEAIPVQRSCGRWVHHSPEFRRREREFPRYRPAIEWERKNIDRLYRRWKRRLR